MATKNPKHKAKIQEGETFNPEPFVESFEKLTDSPQKEEKQKKKVGAPTTYTQHIANVICMRIAEGESLREIVKTEGMPDRTTVYDWLLRHEEFAHQYTRAREEQADTLADEILAIADEAPEVDYIRDKHGNVIDIKIDSGYVSYQKQRIDSRKWIAMKLKPKKYGDKLALGGDAENPLELGNTMFGELLKNVELKLQVKNEQ
jgi:frataxin-like iron-binding protein CyaY